MKKISLFALFVALATVNVCATDLVTETTHVTWNTPLHIEAAKFATAQPGQKIVITYTDAKEMDGEANKGSVIEFKVMNAHFDHLAGSREALRLWDNGALEQFFTEDAVDSLKAYGLEIVGNDFTVTKVELADGKTLKEGFTVWTGFFWADEWSTLELYWNGYAAVDWTEATALRIYSEANRSDFIINIKESWDEGGQIASQADMTAGDGYMELALTDALKNRLSNAGHWMIQFNKEQGTAFNVTDIVLVGNDTTTAISNTVVETKTVKTFENGQVIIIKNGERYNVLGTKY